MKIKSSPFYKLIYHVGIAAISVVLVACSGGGGGSSGSAVSQTPVASSSATTFTAAAMAGELLTYTLDTTNLTYSYTITDSMYGLANKTSSGTLTLNSDGTYSPSGMANAKIAVLPNGLMLGAIRESINGVSTTIPIIGMTTPVTTVAAAAGTYNFVQRSCLSGACNSYYGTFKINSDATWTSCPSGNLTTGCAGATNSGTLNSLGGGKWQIMQGAANIGTAIAFSSAGQNVAILDLKDTRAGGFGVGVLVGSAQQSINTTQTNGTWVATTTNGDWGTFTATGTQIAYQTVNGAPSTATTILTLNSPWTGFGISGSGGHGLLAGTGVYAYQNSGGYAEIGLKIN